MKQHLLKKQVLFLLKEGAKLEQPIAILNKEDVKKGIIAIGQELIRRADDITNDLERVTTITIHSVLSHDEFVNLDVSKNYIAIEEKEEQLMYINPFLAGIIATLLVEILGIIGVAIYFAIKQNKNK